MVEMSFNDFFFAFRSGGHHDRLNRTSCAILLQYNTQRIQGECLLISSLPGNALRTLVDIARLAERFNMRYQSRAW